ncbi:RNA polymerase sigma factor [Microtetraspora malaysiensis]|uniref:RNA polymerase sigma factor n=1 Tax=Microtetraspora malaysiensis TaxID=161358 RepID=UPI003D912144
MGSIIVTGETAAHVAERTARTSYGRLVALLAAPTGDLELAEDTLAQAFEQALTAWPRDGVPDNPEGWLLTVARNRQRDLWKSAAHRRNQPLEAATGIAADAVSPLNDLDPDQIPDRRLALLFVCAHPAIAANVRTPLMLQAVLGFDSAQIARAFALPAGAMSQRLVRVKRRIRDAKIPFVVPGRHAMPQRLPPVLEAVYGCYALAFPERGDGASLAGEARYLAVTTATLLGDEPEAWALAALLTLASARATTPGDRYLPLQDQDPDDWDHGLITEGEAYLRRAERPGQAPGRFQLEAAIQAVHCDRARSGATDWNALCTLYTALVAIAPSLGSRVARAAVIGRTQSPQTGLSLLEALPVERERFQPYHAACGDLLARLGRHQDAVAAYAQAATLSADPALRAFLERRTKELSR